MSRRLGVTLGDPAGVGPEIVAAVLRDAGADPAELRLYGDITSLARYLELPSGVELRPHASAAVEPGRPDSRAAAGTVAAVQAAAHDCMKGEIDGMVTGPISKEILSQAGFAYPGHTELLAEAADVEQPVMLLVGGSLRVALATIHCALREVPDLLNKGGLIDVLEVLDRGLHQLFGLGSPRIAVCGLNPHAGEGGRFGNEESTVIGPAVEAARAKGIDAYGPLSGDSVFSRAVGGEFDVVLGMYHDQALAPLKVHAFGRAVNVTLGLPFVRTSVDHGTAFDIAGQGQADASSMVEAIRLCRELSKNSRSAQRPE